MRKQQIEMPNRNALRFHHWATRWQDFDLKIRIQLNKTWKQWSVELPEWMREGVREPNSVVDNLAAHIAKQRRAKDVRRVRTDLHSAGAEESPVQCGNYHALESRRGRPCDQGWTTASPAKETNGYIDLEELWKVTKKRCEQISKQKSEAGISDRKGIVTIVVVVCHICDTIVTIQLSANAKKQIWTDFAVFIFRRKHLFRAQIIGGWPFLWGLSYGLWFSPCFLVSIICPLVFPFVFWGFFK